MGRVLFLVILLCLVLYGMFEAGKPENWKWMGFDEPTTLTSESNDGDDRQAPSEGKPSSAPRIVVPEPSDQESTDVAGKSSENAAVRQEPEPGIKVELATASREEFWRQTFRRLDRNSRLEFFEFVQKAAGGQPIDATSLQINQKTFKLIDSFRSSYHTNLLELMIKAADEPTLGPPSENASSWSELLLQLQQTWEYKTAPAIRSSLKEETLSEEQQSNLKWLRDKLVEIAFGQIQDGTADIRDIELPAWSYLNSQLAKSSDDELQRQSMGITEMTQLLGQTSFYRGKVVSIRGRLKRLQRIPLSQPIAGQVEVFEMWIAPTKRTIFPFSVYSLELPAEFHDVGLELVELDREIELEGYLFKKRFFSAADGSPASCPLILAKMPRISPAAAQNQQTDFGFNGTMLTALVFGAVALAWLAARLALGSSRRRRLAGVDENTLNGDLETLRNDPEVKTVEERLEKFHE